MSSDILLEGPDGGYVEATRQTGPDGADPAFIFECPGCGQWGVLYGAPVDTEGGLTFKSEWKCTRSGCGFVGVIKNGKVHRIAGG